MLVRPTTEASASQREAFIRAKYETRLLLRAADAPPPGSLHAAALEDDPVLAARCLAHGLDMDQPGPDGGGVGAWTPAAAAAHAGRSAVQVAAAVRSETVLELLLQNLARSAGGVDHAASDPDRKTALHLAVDAGHAVCVEQLITRGANISAADAHQGTPMHAAGLGEREDLVKLMLEYKLAQDEKLLRQIHVGDDE